MAKTVCTKYTQDLKCISQITNKVRSSTLSIDFISVMHIFEGSVINNETVKPSPGLDADGTPPDATLRKDLDQPTNTTLGKSVIYIYHI